MCDTTNKKKQKKMSHLSNSFKMKRAGEQANFIHVANQHGTFISNYNKRAKNMRMFLASVAFFFFLKIILMHQELHLTHNHKNMNDMN